MNDRLSFPTVSVQAAAAALAALPGVTVLIGGVGVPASLKVSFGALYTIAGTLTILVLGLHREWIQARSRRAVTVVSILLALAGLVTFFTYQSLYRSTVFTVVDARGPAPREIEYYMPLWATGELEEMLQTAGSRHDAVADYGPDRFREELAESYLALPMAVTDLALLIPYVLLGVFFTGAISLAGWRLEAT